MYAGEPPSIHPGDAHSRPGTQRVWMRQFSCQVIFMSEKENVPFTCMLTGTAVFPSCYAQPAVDPNHGSHPGNACPGTPDPNLNLHRLANAGSWSVLEQHFCNEQDVGNP